jgi:hypothetical protein
MQMYFKYTLNANDWYLVGNNLMVVDNNGKYLSPISFYSETYPNNVNIVIVSYFRDMFEQAEIIVKRMRNMRGIDFQNDWKIVTIFVGANDLCNFCLNKVSYVLKKRKLNSRRILNKINFKFPQQNNILLFSLML